MNKPTVASGILTAFVIALAAWVGWPMIRAIFPWSFETPMMIALVSGLYGGYLLAVCPGRSGKVLLVLTGLAVTAATFIMPMQTVTMLAMHGLWIWVVRCLCFERSFISASLDGLLLAVGFAAGLVVAKWTGGTFLPVWSVFLLQALFVCIPDQVSEESEDSRPVEDQFARSHRIAEAAIRQIVTR